MKGKTGKPAMRGGGLARKGVGAALKGGGMARRGVGAALADGGMSKATTKFPSKSKGGVGAGGSFSGVGGSFTGVGGRIKSTPETALASGRKSGSSRFKDGGKIKKMAVGGPAAMNPAGKTLPAQAQAVGLRRPVGGPMTRPGFPAGGGNVSIKPMPGGPQIGLPKIGGPLITPGPQIGGPLPPAGPDYKVGMPGPGYSLDGGPMLRQAVMKKGGKVKAYAKGGAVKMTAGAGSGSGRLEKVAAHKSAKRVPAQNLKHGGKAKGK